MNFKRELLAQNSQISRAILFVIILLCSIPIFGQGWELLYDEGDRSVGVDVIETTDGHFLTLTRLHKFLELKTQIVKTDAAGNIVNVIDIAGGSSGELANSFLQLDDGSFIITGTQSVTDWNIDNSQAFIMKADAD